MRAVFMGTPDFAVPCLERIISDGHDVAAVFCQPDRPKGRGYNLVPPQVKESAVLRGIPVHQPISLKDHGISALLRRLAPDIIIVVAYGRILPSEILNLAPLGCINIHASLLPKLRGAAPIQWSIINGDDKTGITVMKMDKGLDTGDIILARETPIYPQETSGELFTRLSALGADCLSQAIDLLGRGEASFTPQDDSESTYAPMIEKSLGNIDFRRSAAEIVNLVRGLNPSPGAYTFIGERRIKVLRAAATNNCDGLVFPCADGYVELVIVQPEGKKPMEGCAFMRGITS